MTSNILTISGTVNALGRKLSKGSAVTFDYVEIQKTDGAYEKLVNVYGYSESARGLVPGDDVTLVVAHTAKAQSPLFPSNMGFNTLYAVASKSKERTFDDVNTLNAEADKLHGKVKFGRILVTVCSIASVAYGLVQGHLGGAIAGAVFSFFVFGIIYLMNFSGLASAAQLYGEAQEVDAAVSSARKLAATPA